MGSADPISISTDQVAAFVELARRGSLREAARELHITEQGLRNRLISLEDRLGVELYRKRRGRRQATPLTNAGQRLLPLGRAFLSGAADMFDLFAASTNTTQSIRVLASQYLIHYLLIDAVKRLHAVEPDLQIRLSARTETDIADVLRTDAEVCVGLAAPYEPSPELDRALARLPGRKLVYTNGSLGHATRVLERLGVGHHFEAVHDIVAAEYRPKHDAAAHAHFVARHGVEPRAAAMFDDIPANLRPAADLGMTTIWVRHDRVDGAPDTAHVDHVTDDLIACLEDWPVAE